jgi:hypothetical protein
MMAHIIQRKGEPKIIYIFRIIGLVILGLIGAVAIALLLGYVVVWLWNWLMPALFGFNTITFWQAVALMVLARILIGGFANSHKRPRESRMPGRWKTFIKKCSGQNDWKYYNDYWKEEGEQAFTEYVNRKKEE